MFSTTKNRRFMLVGLVSPLEHKEKMLANFEELELLVRTYGGRVYAAATQNSTRADLATYLGKGKVQEVADTIGEKKIDIVVVNDNVKPGILYTLKKIFERGNPDIVVWDKVWLILEIFRNHATTTEANLQIKLASIRHMGPRIYGMGMELSQQAGGIGIRGIGETSTELMLRHYRREIRKVKKKLKKLTKTRYQQMNRRKKSGRSTVSIIGYTNAGKTTLFNRLTRKKNLVEDALFATLDSSVGKLFLPKLQQETYLTDTIGFIQNLPPQLIDAFKSTLMETVHADILLHVVDVSDQFLHEKIAVVEQILTDLNIATTKQIYVFNKIDKCKKFDKKQLSAKYNNFQPQFISAKTGKGCDNLIEVIQKTLKQNMH